MSLRALFDAGKIKPFRDALAGSQKEALELDDDGQSLLHLAVIAKSGKYLEFAQALVDAGVPIDIENEAKNSPLHELLSNAGGTLSKQHLATFAWLLERGANVNHPGEIEASTLHTAIIKGAQMEVVEKLIAAGADGARRDHTARTAFFLSMGTLNAQPLWDLLLSKFGGLDILDESGNTPLHEAVSRHNASSVKYLLAKGADPLAKNAKGQSPLDEANRYAKKLVPLLS